MSQAVSMPLPRHESSWAHNCPCQKGHAVQIRGSRPNPLAFGT